jgi:hypothetical protein
VATIEDSGRAEGRAGGGEGAAASSVGGLGWVVLAAAKSLRLEFLRATAVARSSDEVSSNKSFIGKEV